jgi:hypothetical protein
MKKTLLVAVASVFTVAASAIAGSPKGDSQALKIAPDATPDMIDRSLKSASPKGISLVQSFHNVSSSGPSVDLARAARPTMSPKDPRYETALRENAAQQAEIQVAPLK